MASFWLRASPDWRRLTSTSIHMKRRRIVVTFQLPRLFALELPRRMGRFLIDARTFRGAWLMVNQVLWRPSRSASLRCVVASRYEPMTCIALDPLNGVPSKVLPINVAWLSPDCSPVLWVLNCKTISSNPSPFTSCRDEWTGDASVPVLPNFIVGGFTLVASNVEVERMTTGKTP